MTAFAIASPWLTFWLALVAMQLGFSFGFRCWNRLLRCINIALRGWPPAHLDADGDSVDHDGY